MFSSKISQSPSNVDLKYADVGIMQPYFFPYLGYFDLILKTDEWVVFDVVNYRRRSWMNRNRILEQTYGWQYISIPVQHSSGKNLSSVRVVDKSIALGKVLERLRIYNNHAPFYSEVISLVKQAFDACESRLLRDLNTLSVLCACQYMGIPFSYKNASELNLDFSGVSHPGQWALEICQQLHYSSYLNPQGGKEIFIPEEWESAQIDLLFSKTPNFSYETNPKLPFQSNMSIIDVLMWNEPEKVVAYLNNWSLETS